MICANPNSLHSSTSSCLTPRESKTSGGAGIVRESAGTLAGNGTAGHPRPHHNNTEISSRYKPSASPPKRVLSAERQHLSTTRTTDTVVSTSSIHGSSVPKLVGPRGGLLWPSSRSTRSSSSARSSSSSSMQGHHDSSPSGGTSKNEVDGPQKALRHSSYHTLKQSVIATVKPVDTGRRTSQPKGSPLRPKILDQTENAKPSMIVTRKIDQQRGQGPSNMKVFAGTVIKSMNLTAEREETLSRAASLLEQGKPASSTAKIPHAVSSSRNLFHCIGEGPVAPFVRRRQVESRGRGRCALEGLSAGESMQTNSSNQLELDSEKQNHPSRQSRQSRQQNRASFSSLFSSENTSDVESISSAGTAAALSSSRGSQRSGAVRGTRGATVPAKLSQDISGIRNISDVKNLKATPHLLKVSTCKSGHSAVVISMETQIESISSSWSSSNHPTSIISSPQQRLSPMRTPRIASPLRSYPSSIHPKGSSRTLPSNSLQSNQPSSRTALQSNKSSSTSTLTFGVQEQRGKKGLSQLEDAHLHRILHNRLLQWRFVNARAKTVVNIQRLAAEKSLHSVWGNISELQASVTAKRIKVQQHRLSEKLFLVLSAQSCKLEHWSILQEDHSTALSGAIQALEAATLRVPVVAGLRVDIQAVNQAVSAAADIINALESSVRALMPKAEKANWLVYEIAHAAAQEKALLEDCLELLVHATALEDEEHSLRTYLIQYEQEKSRVLGHLLNSTRVASDSLL